METLVEMLNHFIDGEPYTVTGNVSVQAVKHCSNQKYMEPCTDEEADQYGVYIEIMCKHNNDEYTQWCWINDFPNRKQASTYAEAVKAALPAYYFISGRIGSVKGCVEDFRLDLARVVKGHVPNAPLAAKEFQFNGEIYTCLNAACF